MRLSAILLLLFLASPRSLLADGLGAPQLSPAIDTPGFSDSIAAGRFFDAAQLLNTGIRFAAPKELTLEPQLGVGYSAREQEFHGGVEQSTHRLHAQAGWRLSLAESFYLSAAGKLPVVTVEKKGVADGEELGSRPDIDTRAGYDFITPSRASVGWTGEVGIRLLPRADLMLYYDQNPLDGWSFTNQYQEERIGTRFIIRFQ